MHIMSIWKNWDCLYRRYAYCKPLESPSALLASMVHFQTAMIIVVPVNLGTTRNAQNAITDTVQLMTNVATVTALTVTWMRLM